MKEWLKRLEPKTWVATLLPILITFALMKALKEPIIWINLLLFTISALLLQMATNCWNDTCDLLRNTPLVVDQSVEKEKSGLKKEALLSYQKATLILYLLSIFFGIILIILSSWKLLILGVVGIVVSYGYSWGRYPLSFLPLGEIVSGGVMGYGLAIGTLWANHMHVTPWLWGALLPQVILIATLLLTNNICDIERDQIAKRKTVAILLGRRRSVKLLWGLISLSWIAFWSVPLLFFHRWSWLIVLWSGWMLIRIARFKSLEFDYLNRPKAMKSVAKLLLLMSIGGMHFWLLGGKF